MTTEKIGGYPLSDLIGGGDPEVIAREILAVLIKYARLSPDEVVLDVGCGCGRIATGLTQYMSPTSRYVGVDIVPGFIDFGRKFISARYPNFHFSLLDQANQSYDWWRQIGDKSGVRSLAELLGSEQADLAFAISLFTHLDFDDALKVLLDIHPLVKDSGRVFVTIFLLDDCAAEAVQNHRSEFSFKYKTKSEKLFAEKAEEETYAVAYTEEVLAKLLDRAGFALEKVIRGYWSTSEPGETYQDGILLRKA